MPRHLWTRGLCTAALALTAAPLAWAAGELLLVSGRWDNTVLVIDLGRAMDPANDGTPNAIINRVRVTPDIDVKGSGVADTPASGQPVNVVLSPDRRRTLRRQSFRLGDTDRGAEFQHGHAGTVTILDVAKTLDPANAGTLKAVEAIVPTDGFGPVGLTVTPGRQARAGLGLRKAINSRTAAERFRSSISRRARSCTRSRRRGAIPAFPVRRIRFRTTGRTWRSAASPMRTPSRSVRNGRVSCSPRTAAPTTSR